MMDPEATRIYNNSTVNKEFCTKQYVRFTPGTHDVPGKTPVHEEEHGSKSKPKIISHIPNIIYLMSTVPQRSSMLVSKQQS